MLVDYCFPSSWPGCHFVLFITTTITVRFYRFHLSSQSQRHFFDSGSEKSRTQLALIIIVGILQDGSRNILVKIMDIPYILMFFFCFNPKTVVGNILFV